jgi:ABC-type sugar transport system ATPase subunit
MTTKLKLQKIYKRYGSKLVLNGLDLDVEDGEFMVVLGPSGMGKSTLLRVIVGIESLTAGKVIVDGRDVSNLPPNKRDIAMVFQNYALYPNMTAYKNIAFPLRMSRMPAAEINKKVNEIAETLKIADILDRNINLLSGGQKQRVALARSLVRNPKMFLLDEPLSNLDARVRFSARTELKKLQKELGYTFMYVTHDQQEASTLADRVAVLRNGQIEQLDDYEHLINAPKSRWLGDFVGDFPMNFIDGKIIGKEDKEIGFRDSWISEKGNDLSATVEYCQVNEDIYRAYCKIDDEDEEETTPGKRSVVSDDKKTSVILRVGKRYNPGDKVHFSLTRYNVYLKGLLETSVTE